MDTNHIVLDVAIKTATQTFCSLRQMWINKGNAEANTVKSCETMTLTLKELQNDIIIAWCKNCGEQSRFTPVEPRIVEKSMYYWPTGKKKVLSIYRRPERYVCNKCGVETRFKTLASAQIGFHHKKEWNGEEEKQR